MYFWEGKLVHPPFEVFLFVEVGKHDFFQQLFEFYFELLAYQILLLFKTVDFLHDGILELYLRSLLLLALIVLWLRTQVLLILFIVIQLRTLLVEVLLPSFLIIQFHNSKLICNFRFRIFYNLYFLFKFLLQFKLISSKANPNSWNHFKKYSWQIFQLCHLRIRHSISFCYETRTNKLK